MTKSLDADALVTWSPWKQSYRQTVEAQFVADGRPVIVVENGWLSPVNAIPHYQIALGGWNGTGAFEPGPARRWRSWGISPLRWKSDGLYALIIGQRGHPCDDRTAAKGWHERVEIDYPLVIRRGRADQTPLKHHLAKAAEVHVWTSSAATWALLYGVPVVQHGPCLMTSDLCSRPGDVRVFPERTPVFERLAWAQWAADEIETGVPMARLLEGARSA